MEREVVRVDVNEFLRRNRYWMLGLGVVMVVLGVAAIALPLMAGWAIAVVLGWLLAIGGVFQVIHAFRCRSAGQLLWELLVGILYLVAGAILLLHPLEGVVTLTLVVAALLIVEGVFQLVLAMRWRPAGHWGWLLASGLLALLLGVVIWAGLPETAAWVLGLMVGINLLFNGVTLLVAAMNAPGGNERSF